jgi:hypothetical protein
MIHFLCWFALPVLAQQGHTELRVEALEAPDRRVELLAELARARASLADQSEALKTIPEGDDRQKFLNDLKTLKADVATLEKAIAAAPAQEAEAPAVSPSPAPALVRARPPAVALAEQFNVLVALGLGAIAGVLAGLLFLIGRLPSVARIEGPRSAHLISMAMLLMAIGPALMRMNYDQTGVVLGWALLSCAALLRFAQRRFGSQVEAILLEASSARARAKDPT